YLMLYNSNFYFIFSKQKQIISNRFDANQLLNSLKISHQQKLLLYLNLQLGLRSISVIIESNRSVIGFRSVNLIEFTDISVSVNYRSVSVIRFRFRFFDLPNRFTDYIIKTFCRLSRQRMMMESQNYRHSNRLDAMSRMVVVQPFTTTGCRDNWQNVYKIADSLTFCRLSRQRM